MIPGPSRNWIAVNAVQPLSMETIKQNIMTSIRFTKFSSLIATVFLLATASAAPGAVVTTDGFELKLNGQPFVIKGMNYSPVPIGAVPRFMPYGDYFIPYYANVWKPDIDKMRKAGINVIKLYAGNPDLNAGAPGTAGNWKQFLDYCYNDGNNPIYVVMFSYTQGGQIAEGGAEFRKYIRDYDKLVKSTIKHPAVFGYMIGNEIFDGVTQNPQFWTNFGNLIDAASGAGLNQGQKPFLTSAVNDEFTPATSWPAIKRGEQSGKLGNLDSWSINIYRGPHFGGAGNSVFTQYLELMNSFTSLKKPLILGEWGTPHTTRPVPVYGHKATTPVSNLDDVPESQMGQDQPYFAAQPVASFLTTQWDTIKANLKAGSNQVCTGGFIFDWCDEYWKGDPNNVNPVMQIGGPASGFLGNAFAGGYSDEAGFGVTSAVDQSTYGGNKPNISRRLFKGYNAVKAFYNDSSSSAGELYLTREQFAAIRSMIKDEIQADRKDLLELREIDVPREPSVRRWLQTDIAVLNARLAFPTDEVLMQLDEMLDTQGVLSLARERRVLERLHARLAKLQRGG
jgi:hypothetical protein